MISLKCEEPIDEPTVQVWLLYHHPNFKYSIICLFRIAVGPDEKFGIDRVPITESLMFRLKD